VPAHGSAGALIDVLLDCCRIGLLACAALRRVAASNTLQIFIELAMNVQAVPSVQLQAGAHPATGSMQVQGPECLQWLAAELYWECQQLGNRIQMFSKPGYLGPAGSAGKSICLSVWLVGWVFSCSICSSLK
jgi:hypothetical protein